MDKINTHTGISIGLVITLVGALAFYYNDRADFVKERHGIVQGFNKQISALETKAAENARQNQMQWQKMSKIDQMAIDVGVIKQILENERD